MIGIEKWLESFTDTLEKKFGERIEFIGLQGSYARNEATDSSDIDVVVLFDELSIEDLKKYDAAVSKLPHRELLCGFVSGKNELMNWDRADLFQFYFDTRPVKGNLDYLLPLIDRQAVRRAIHLGACNIYHMCVHNILHEKDAGILKALYKSASFVEQAIYYEQSGEYIRLSSELLQKAQDEDKEIIRIFRDLKENEAAGESEFENFSSTLFLWSKRLIMRYH